MPRFFLLIGVLAIAGASTAQAQGRGRVSPEWDYPEARQFDFWVGEWSVNNRFFQDNGSWVDGGSARVKIFPILDGKAILDAARASGAGAIHPGYGFLAENAGFAADVIAAGLVWVGPSPESIERMGDKLAAKALAQKAGVPTLAGSENPADADAIGYPLLVKAAAGGGGKGMRVVESAGALDAAQASEFLAFEQTLYERLLAAMQRAVDQPCAAAWGTRGDCTAA